SNNRVHRLRPKVMALLDSRKQRIPEPVMIDLGSGHQAGGPEMAIAQGLQRGAFGVNPAEYYL
ncbi:MAG TPA: hypothetical protein VF859_01630, partial [Burkholderiales bacterium]